MLPFSEYEIPDAPLVAQTLAKAAKDAGLLRPVTTDKPRCVMLCHEELAAIFVTSNEDGQYLLHCLDAEEVVYEIDSLDEMRSKVESLVRRHRSDAHIYHLSRARYLQRRANGLPPFRAGMDNDTPVPQ